MGKQRRWRRLEARNSRQKLAIRTWRGSFRGLRRRRRAGGGRSPPESPDVDDGTGKSGDNHVATASSSSSGPQGSMIASRWPTLNQVSRGRRGDAGGSGKTFQISTRTPVIRNTEVRAMAHGTCSRAVGGAGIMIRTPTRMAKVGIARR